MVKGISKQVIVVNSPEPRLFEQAIFILREEALREGITDDKLLQEARQILRTEGRKERRWLAGSLWALSGAGVTGLVWLATVLI